jgi:hypothetical protein
MIREGRIVRPQFRQAQMFGNACGFAVPCCAVPIYSHCGLCGRISSPRKAAAGFCADANTSILSGPGTVSPEPFRDFYHRFLRLPAPEAATANTTHSIIRSNYGRQTASPERRVCGLTQADVEAKKEMSSSAAATGAHFHFRYS